MKRMKIAIKGTYLIYLIYLGILAAGVVACLIYVNVILHRYEDMRPEQRMAEVVTQLRTDALTGVFWGKYSLPLPEAGNYEENRDIQREYLTQYTDGQMEFVQKTGSYAEDELYYTIENNGVLLAEVKLKATGPAVTRLAVFSFREWQVEYIKPILEQKTYTLSLLSDFDVSVNGIVLAAEDGVERSIDGGRTEITYTISDVYLEPDFRITDKKGNEGVYTINEDKVLVEFYDYTLTLPTALTVELDGERCQGELISEKLVRYDIRQLKKPTVTIADAFGNEFAYEGGAELPFTYATISADSRYEVAVNGEAVPAKAVTKHANPEYEQFADYVENLPQVCVYDIAILEKDAKITVADENGNPVSLEKNKNIYDFTERVNGLETVPEEVSGEVDVLALAQTWSLFLSKDESFAKLAQYLITGSYQHEVARKYATGIDITFTSAHTLANPAFTETSVTNFAWLTDECFSVDIGFVKHMILRSGKKVDDRMNDRFYFVKYDDTDDNIDNPTWKIAGMKEIVNNAE